MGGWVRGRQADWVMDGKTMVPRRRMARVRHHKGPVPGRRRVSKRDWNTPKKKWVCERHSLPLSLFVCSSSEN